MFNQHQAGIEHDGAFEDAGGKTDQLIASAKGIESESIKGGPFLVLICDPSAQVEAAS